MIIARIKSLSFYIPFTLVLTLICVFCGASRGMAQSKADEKNPSDSPNPSLIDVQLGTLDDYSRLIFNFTEPMTIYTVQRLDVDKMLIDFGAATFDTPGPLDLKDRLVADVIVGREKGRLIGRVGTRFTRFNFRHFNSPDGHSVVVDIRPMAPIEDSTGNQGLLLEVPTAGEVARKIREGMPLRPQPGTDQAMLAQALDLLIGQDFIGALTLLKEFDQRYPESPWRDSALFLIGDAAYYQDPAHFNDHFLEITQSYETALAQFPKSSQAPRAKLMLALAYMKTDFLTEAAGFLKSMTTEYPDSYFTALARIFLARVYLELGKRDLAKAEFDQVLSLNPRGDLFLDAYYLLGKSYYKDGLFSQSAEIYREILAFDDQFYISHPEILYELGEGYFHLGRMELSRAFLYHGLNMQPDIPDVDMMMARLGDTYKDDKLDADAIKIYNLTVNLHPDSAGALISQMRLADFGALSHLFPQESVFRELENGAWDAALKIYEGILKSEQDSPLIELAMFKLGLIYMHQEDYLSALKTFKEIIASYPRGQLADNARKLASQAISRWIKNMFTLKQYQPLIAFYKENKELVNEDDWPNVRHFLGIAYAALDQPTESVQLLEANKGMSEDEAARLLTLGRNYIKLGRYEDAAVAFEEFRSRFPDKPEVARTLLEQARAEFLEGKDYYALPHLEEAISREPSLGDNAEIQDILARLYLKKGDLRKGIAALEKYVGFLESTKAKPVDLFLACSRLGQAYADVGDKEKAEAAVEKALEMMPSNQPPENLYLIANLRRSLGLEEKYRETLDMLVTSTDPFWRQVAEQEIQALQPNERLTRLLNEEPDE